MSIEKFKGISRPKDVHILNFHVHVRVNEY